MKVLWLCNMVPGAVREQLGGAAGGGLWVDHVLKDLQTQDGLQLHILCRGDAEAEGALNEKASYAIFREGKPYRYSEELETLFSRQLSRFRPDVIHIWGTEYGHSLAMVNAGIRAGMQEKLIISIQGLCGVYSRHFCEGLPTSVQYGFTLRDLLRWDNVDHQRRVFTLRGKLEEEALRKVSHVIGRTPWDQACTAAIHPERTYHFCNETLREPFFEGKWQYASCKKHSIFASSCAYPVKGFHYLLEAFREVRKFYPDATLSVPGKCYLPSGIKGYLSQDSYRRYLTKLTREYGLEEHIRFLGNLDAEQMKQAFLEANVFVLPSTIENSPNSLGEAMLLGVPSVAADVGGVSTMLKPWEEGLAYPSTAPYMLAHHILSVFAMEDKAEAMGAKAAAHAHLTHDARKNLQDLLAAYTCIAKGNA